MDFRALASLAAHRFEGHGKKIPLIEKWIAPGDPLTLNTHDVITPEHGIDSNLFLVTRGCMAPKFVDDPFKRGHFPLVFGSILFAEKPSKMLGFFGNLEVITLSPSTLWRIPRDHHQKLLKNIEFATLMNRRYMQDLSFSRNLLSIHCTSSGVCKIVRILILLATFAGERRDNILMIPIQQDYLAGLTGLTRRSINRFLARARKEGMLETSHEVIYVTDETRLLKEAKMKVSSDSQIHTIIEHLQRRVLSDQ